MALLFVSCAQLELASDSICPGFRQCVVIFTERIRDTSPSFSTLISRLMSPSERTALRILIDLERARARRNYTAAGRPFGPGRGLDVWIEYGQKTTVN